MKLRSAEVLLHGFCLIEQLREHLSQNSSNLSHQVFKEYENDAFSAYTSDTERFHLGLQA